MRMRMMMTMRMMMMMMLMYRMWIMISPTRPISLASRGLSLASNHAKVRDHLPLALTDPELLQSRGLGQGQRRRGG
jgi:hypothetical protein